MAMFKKLILLGAAVALLPTDHAQQARFYEQAAGAVHWTATFCDRNGAVCAEGQALWTTFVKKAEFGAEVAYGLVQQHLAPALAPAQPAAIIPAPARGTLRPEDLQPGWRGTAEGSRRGT